MRRISKRVGGGAISLVDDSFALDSASIAYTSPEDLKRTLKEFRETERKLPRNPA